jgi:ATP-dependent DNA ligase
MQHDTRNFKDFSNKLFFPGKINKTTGSYEFPTLYHLDDNDNKRMWKITIRLIKGTKKKYDIDWDLLYDNTIPIKTCYLNDDKIPEGTHAQYYVETGVINGKITRHIPSYSECKNINKSNERNVFKQALVSTRSKYLKKKESGFVTDEKGMCKNTNLKYFPMLVHKYNEKIENVKYPVLVQPKLDGTRCIVFLNKPKTKKIQDCTVNDVVMYTRQQKDYTGFINIKELLLEPLIELWNIDKKESVYLDGELYKHGENLQTISGAVRNIDRDNITKYKDIQYWIFDLFYPSELNLPVIKRLDIINDLFMILPKNKIIVNTPIYKIKKESDLDLIYNNHITDKYEGIIIRNMDSLYLTHPTKESAKIRSKHVLKRKKRYSNEYEVVNFKQGEKGRDIGAIMWILKTIDSNGKEHEFNATPKNTTYEERYDMFKKFKLDKNLFTNEYKGRMMTVEYEDLSKKNVPLRAKSIGFREHV